MTLVALLDSSNDRTVIIYILASLPSITLSENLSFEPRKDIIEKLIQHLPDTTSIGEHASVNAAAGSALAIYFEKEPVKTNIESYDESIETYARWKKWWEENSNKIVWDWESRQFKLSGSENPRLKFGEDF